MAEPTTEVIQGTLDMLILRSVELQPMHGFGITQRIEQISAGVFRVNPGSLLLAFQRMERAGLIDSEWQITENNRRAKLYRITSKGKKQLKETRRDWERRVEAIARQPKLTIERLGREFSDKPRRRRHRAAAAKPQHLAVPHRPHTVKFFTCQILRRINVGSKLIGEQ